MKDVRRRNRHNFRCMTIETSRLRMRDSRLCHCPFQRDGRSQRRRKCEYFQCARAIRFSRLLGARKIGRERAEQSGITEQRGQPSAPMGCGAEARKGRTRMHCALFLCRVPTPPHGQNLRLSPALTERPAPGTERNLPVALRSPSDIPPSGVKYALSNRLSAPSERRKLSQL